MTQDLHRQAQERFDDAIEAESEQRSRMREDLHFSNPADPQQWSDDALRLRGNRVCLTLDRTNQYIMQVVNSARMNKPGITVMPADSRADVEVAKRLDGIIRHIEYRSRASIAYDTAIDHAARCGRGWMRVLPKVVRPETNLQEIEIRRVHDPMSVVIDGDSTEPDGSDAMFGFVEVAMSNAAFKRRFPKASPASWKGRANISTSSGDGVVVCEYQYVVEIERDFVVVEMPETGEEVDLSEDDYKALAQQIGFEPRVVRTFSAMERSVKWCHLSGAEVLEETDFPSRWIGFVPVLGFELFVGGKRYICGITRRMMDSQRAYNYERSAGVESVALQPKVPIMTPVDAIQGHERHWSRLNDGSPAYLPYNHIDDDGNPVPAPQRMTPPAFPTAFAQAGQLALGDMEASVGINRATLGMPDNANSGKQERERREQGQVATYHFADDLSRSIEHLGRIVVDMIPRVYDTKRQARILGVDGKQDQIEVDPSLPQAVRRQGSKVVAINPGVGAYDVRVVAGANYTTQRQEAADGIAQVLQAAPNFAPILAPVLVKMRDWPEADKVSRMLLAMAPPQVQAIASEGEDGGEAMAITPQAQAQLQQLQQQLQQQGQQMQQMAQMLDAAEKRFGELEQENETLKADRGLEQAKLAAQVESDEAKEALDRFRAETERMKVMQQAAMPAPPAPEPPAPPPPAPTVPPVTVVVQPTSPAASVVLERGADGNPIAAVLRREDGSELRVQVDGAPAVAMESVM